jgi:xanthine dehydrogenase small subunit
MISFYLNGRPVKVEDESVSLLDTLRDWLGITSAKDGCSPQGQCGCCTVWVDGTPRVACVTPLRRVAGRQVTTLEGLGPYLRDLYAETFTASGASQCGFCTPGIIMRLAADQASGQGNGEPDEPTIRRMLAHHLCRCTGWQGIVDAALDARRGGPRDVGPRDFDLAAKRALIEGRSPQHVGPKTALGDGGFAADAMPAGSLSALPVLYEDGYHLDEPRGWAVGQSTAAARSLSGKLQGRRSTADLGYPVDVPEGRFDFTLATTFVEPAYLEPDASWCLPGGEPASALANGGAFGGKRSSPAPEAARMLAAAQGWPVKALFSREDVVRLGPKRPPMAAGIRLDGTGALRVARTPGSEPLEPWVEAFASVLPRVDVEIVEVPGPPVSPAIRGAGWTEAAVLDAVCVALSRKQEAGSLGPATASAEVVGREGGLARATMRPDGTLLVEVEAGDPLDVPVLRSYCVGAVHQALGWVLSEGIAVDSAGRPLDLTIRSFGILGASSTPRIEVEVLPTGGPPLNASDTVFAASAAAAWISLGLPPRWPARRGGER